jgi:hypothetical protein
LTSAGFCAAKRNIETKAEAIQKSTISFYRVANEAKEP